MHDLLISALDDTILLLRVTNAVAKECLTWTLVSVYNVGSSESTEASEAASDAVVLEGNNLTQPENASIVITSMEEIRCGLCVHFRMDCGRRM
jgi:hypothetical protein